VLTFERSGPVVRHSLIVFCALLVFSASSAAISLSELAGRYVYAEYNLTFPNGAVFDLAALGVRNAELSVFADGTLVSRMTMTSGEPVVSKGSVTDVRLEGGRGSWVEHWPELGYPVTRQIERTVDGFAYSARFDDPRDTFRYGSVDRGVLRRIGDVDEGDREAAAAMAPSSMPRVPLSEDEARRLGEQVANGIQVEPTARPAGERESQPFFTEPSLAALGCMVPEGLGRYEDIAAPGIPDARAFLLVSRSGCAIDLFNLIQRTDGGAGLWAGLRAQAMGEARRRGYEIENREGELGERSELRIFTENGAYRGFWYAIEAGNVLYVLRIFSDQIQISPELETLLREKLALAAE